MAIFFYSCRESFGSVDEAPVGKPLVVRDLGITCCAEIKGSPWLMLTIPF